MSTSLVDDSDVIARRRPRLLVWRWPWAVLAVGCGASALLISLGSPPIAAPFAAAVALLPWVATARHRGLGIRALAGLAVGTASAVATIHWIPEALANLGSSAPLAARAAALVFVCVLFVGLPYSVLGLLAHGGGRGLALRLTLGVFAVDWIRVNALAVPAWGAIGQAQAGTGLAQVARLGGVAGVSALVAGVCGAIVAASSPGRGRGLAAARSVAAAWAGAIVALYLCAEPALRAMGSTVPSRSLEVLVVQPHVPPEERAHADLQLAHLATLERMTRESVAQAVRPLDLITWPEASLTLQQADAKAALERVRDVAVAARTPIVLGLSELLANGDTRNTAVWIDPEAGVRGQYEKARPIPVLEARSSWAGWAGWVLFGLPVDRGLVRAGASEGRGLVRDGIATILCFEVFFPEFVTRATGGDARAIVNLASDSWTPSSAAREQELRFASFRAIESRLPLVRTSHGGPSVVFDAYGREIARIPDGQSGTLAISVSAPSVSIAAETAMLFVIGSGGALIGLALRRFLVGGGMRR